MSRTLQLMIAVLSYLTRQITAQSTTIVSVLDVGDGPTPISTIDNMPISDPPLTASVINAAPTGTTYFALPSFDASDIANDGTAELSSAYGATLTIAPSAYDMTVPAGNLSLHCDMSGTVPTVCTTIGLDLNDGDDATTTTPTTMTLTTTILAPGPTDFFYSAMTVNAGVEKLASATTNGSSTTVGQFTNSTASTPAPSPMAPSNATALSTTAALTPSGTSATPTAKTTGAADRSAIVGVGGLVAGLAAAMLHVV